MALTAGNLSQGFSTTIWRCGERYFGNLLGPACLRYESCGSMEKSGLGCTTFEFHRPESHSVSLSWTSSEAQHGPFLALLQLVAGPIFSFFTGHIDLLVVSVFLHT